MAGDNTRLPVAETSGDLMVTREVTHGGDTAKLAGGFLMGTSGTEGAYTAEAIDGTAANGLEVDVTRVQGNVATTNAEASQADGHSATLGAQADAAASSDTGTFSLLSLFKRLLSRLTTLLPQSSGRLDVSIGASPATVPVSGTVSLTDISNGEYETVAASATDQVLGTTGAANDYLAGVLIVPATTSPGAVSIKDGSGSAITIFTGGSLSVSNLVPFFVPLGIKCATAWKMSTGASVSAIAVGNFS